MTEYRAALPAEAPTLSQSLRRRHITMIAIGGIIGAGLFVGSSAAIAAAGPAILVTYTLTGFLMLLVMRMLGEMAVGMPQVRSFTEFTRVGLGDWAGFAFGWLYWFFWVVVVPVEAIAGAVIIEHWIALPTWQIGVVLMAVMTAVNLLSARAYGEFEFWFSSIKVSAIIAFILIAVAHASGLTAGPAPGFSNLFAHGGFAPNGALAALAAVTTVIFSMVGAEIVTIAAVESAEPARAVARMSSAVILRILLFYVGSILMALCVIPWNTVVPGESPFTLALDTLNIPFASTIMSWIILTAVLSCLNSAFYVCSRVLFVLAGKGDAPRWLVQTNRRQVPSRSVMLASVAGFAGVIAAILSPSRVFAFLLNASGTLIVYIYIAIAVSQVRLRRQLEREGRPPALPMWLFPWLSYLAIAGMLAVIVAMAIAPARAAEFWTSAVSVVVALVASALVRNRGQTAIMR